ncbi:MAG: hypothetical protein ACREUM_04500, partial [Nitrosospira sp.]
KQIWAKLKGAGKKIKDKVKGARDRIKDRLARGKVRDGRERPGDLAGGMRAAHSLLRGRMASEAIKGKLPGIKSRYRLTTLDLVIESHHDRFDYAHAEGTVQRSKTKTEKIPNEAKEPPKVAVGDIIEAKYGRNWAISEITAIKGEFIEYFGHIHSGPVGGTKRIDLYGETWRDYRPGRVYKVGKAFEAIRDLNDWRSYADASQVLSYRAHGKFNVPPGKNWHHIHEQHGGGANSVKNLALVDWRINQVDFRTWFGRPQLGTGNQPLRRFLQGQSEDVHIEWGLRCIKAHGLQVVQKNQGSGPYQEIV